MSLPATAPILLVSPVPTADFTLDALREDAGMLVATMHTTTPAACCPRCGHAATRVHSTYERTLADLAAQGLPVRLHVRVRRFVCTLPDCPRRIFTERLPDLAAPYARRTARLTTVLTRVGVVLGGEAGTRLLPVLGLATSADTLLRLVRDAPADAAGPQRR